MPNPRDQFDLLKQATDHARRVEEELLRHEAELTNDAALEPSVREAGLQAVRAAASAAHRLLLNADSALRTDNIPLNSVAVEHETSP